MVQGSPSTGARHEASYRSRRSKRARRRNQALIRGPRPPRRGYKRPSPVPGELRP